MKPFLEIGFEDHNAVGIDWVDPADRAIENEDAQAVPHAATDEDASLLARCNPGILGALLRFILPPVANPARLRVGGYRLVCLAHQAGIEGIADKSITDLAKQLGITKDALSHWNVRVADELGQFQTRKGKSPAAREAYRASSIEHHKRIGNRTPSLEKREADQAS